MHRLENFLKILFICLNKKNNFLDCKKKRLTAAVSYSIIIVCHFFLLLVFLCKAFSKNQAAKALKSAERAARCKECVATDSTAASTSAAPVVDKSDWYALAVESGEPLKCSECQKGTASPSCTLCCKSLL